MQSETARKTSACMRDAAGEARCGQARAGRQRVPRGTAVRQGGRRRRRRGRQLRHGERARTVRRPRVRGRGRRGDDVGAAQDQQLLLGHGREEDTSIAANRDARRSGGDDAVLEALPRVRDVGVRQAARGEWGRGGGGRARLGGRARGRGRGGDGDGARAHPKDCAAVPLHVPTAAAGGAWSPRAAPIEHARTSARAERRMAGRVRRCVVVRLCVGCQRAACRERSQGGRTQRLDCTCLACQLGYEGPLAERRGPACRLWAGGSSGSAVNS